MTITTDPRGRSDVDDEVDAIDYELPELNLLAAEPDDPDAAVRFAFLDPAHLVPNDINRTFTDDDLADLLASVPVVGFLQAAVVVPIDDAPDRYRVLIGNRRRAVAERLNRQLPALIVRAGDSVQEILAILSENDDRLALKPTEKAALYHQLTLLDWRPAQIAKARGVRTAEVRAALTLIELPVQARQAADDGQLPLDMAADLAEFGDDPKTMAKIIERGTDNIWGFKHAINDARDRRNRKAVADRLFAELTLAGVKVLPKPKGFGYGSKEAAANTLLDADGNRLDPAAVRTLPGFAAFVDKQAYGGPQTVVFCTDPERFGYTRSGHSGYVPEHERAEREAAAAAREAQRIALDTAAQVRQEFLKRSYGNPRAAKANHQQALRDGITNPRNLTYPPSSGSLANAVAGADIVEQAGTAGPDRLTRMLVARWVTAAEHNLSLIAAGRTWDVDHPGALAFLDRLVAAGYELSEAERRLHAEITDHLRDADNSEDEDEDDDIDEE